MSLAAGRRSRSTRAARATTQRGTGSSRRGRDSDGGRIRQNINQAPSRKWTQILRPPAQGFQFYIPTWVPVEELTPEESIAYQQMLEKRREEAERAAAERAAAEAASMEEEKGRIDTPFQEPREISQTDVYVKEETMHDSQPTTEEQHNKDSAALKPTSDSQPTLKEESNPTVVNENMEEPKPDAVANANTEEKELAQNQEDVATTAGVEQDTEGQLPSGDGDTLIPAKRPPEDDKGNEEPPTKRMKTETNTTSSADEANVEMKYSETSEGEKPAASADAPKSDTEPKTEGMSSPKREATPVVASPAADTKVEGEQVNEDITTEI